MCYHLHDFFYFICIVIDATIISKEELIEENKKLQFENFAIRHELEQLKRLIFGKKSERFIPTLPAEQLSMGLLVEEQEAPAPITETILYNRNKPTTKKEPSIRMQFPADLPREEVVIEPIEDITGCVRIGEEVSEVLEMTSAKFYVRKTIRPKYARKNGEGIAIGMLPSRINEKGLLGTSIICQLLVDKFIDHLPVYRQQERMKRIGMDIHYNTLIDATHEGIRWLEVLYDTLKNQVFKSNYIHADETPIKVLDSVKKGTTHRGYFWVYYSLPDRSVLFDYRHGRGMEGPSTLLQDYKGYLQTDGYEVYASLVKNNKDIIHLGCMAHARRKFEEALINDRAIAEKGLTYFQQLYEIERMLTLANARVEEIKITRQQKSVPLLKEMEAWLKECYAKVLPKSPIGKAIFYSLTRWETLTEYTNNGILRIDNNLVENSIRPVALGRKNYLFCGSHQAAMRSAMMYSLFASCKAHGINPEKWLKHVLYIIPNYPINKIADLLPCSETKNFFDSL